MEFDYNISSLEPQEAREIILEVAKALGHTEFQLKKQQEEVQLWTNRLELARAHHREELEREAQGRLDEANSKINLLIQESQDLRRGIGFMKDQLKSPSAALHQRSIDPDLLLEQLNQMVGEKNNSSWEEELQKETLDQALEALKKEIKEGE